MVAVLNPIFMLMFTLVAGLSELWEVDAVTFIAQHRHPCSVYIVTSTLSTLQWKSVHLQEKVSSSGFFTSILSLENMPKIDKICSRNLFVFLTSSPGNQSLLTQVSHLPHLAHQTWLILQEYNDNQDILHEIQLPLNTMVLIARHSQQIVTLMEVYCMGNVSSVTETFYGYLTKNGSVINHQLPNMKHQNLQGIDIQLQFPYSSEELFTNNSGKKGYYGGFFGSVYNLLQQKLDFGPHNSKNILVMEVQAMIQMDVVNFSYTVPVLTTASVLLIRIPDESDVQWGNYLSPFSPKLWFSLAALAFGISCYLTIMYHVIRRVTTEENRDQGFPLRETIFIMINAIEQQGNDNEPQSATCRLIYLVCYLLSVILMASYSASLTSLFTARNDIAAFPNVEELLQTREHRFGVLSGSVEQEMLQWSPNPMVAKLRGQISEYEDLLPALKHVCSSKFSLFTTYEFLHGYIPQLPCRIDAVPGWKLRVDWAFRFPRTESLWSPVTYSCLVFQEMGMLQKLKRDAFLPQLVNDLEDTQVVTLHHITPIITLLAVALLISIILALLEWAFYTVQCQHLQIFQHLPRLNFKTRSKVWHN